MRQQSNMSQKKEKDKIPVEELSEVEINCCSVLQCCLTLCNPMDCRTPWFPVLQYLPEFVQTHVCLELMMSSNHLILCHPFSSCPQFFPAPGSFLMAQFFASGGQDIGALASASLLPMNIRGWFPLGLTCLNSLLSSSVPFSHSVMSDYLWPHGWAGKESACNSWDLGSIPGLGRSPGKRKGYPLPYSGLVNSMDNIPWATCCPRDFQKSSPEPQFENISFWGSAFFMVQLSIRIWLLENT